MLNLLAIMVMTGGSVVAGMPFAGELGLPEPVRSGRTTLTTIVEAGDTVTLMERAGPGCITHIWMTVGECEPRHIVLRMYWDGESEPSVEAPLTDFFGVGHNELAPPPPFATPGLTVAPHDGYNRSLLTPYLRKSGS